jgi:oligopeptidase A
VADNPLVNMAELPPFGAIQPDHVVDGCRALVATLAEDLAALEQTVRPDWDSAVERVTDITEGLSQAWSVVGHLMGVRNSPALRTAHETVQPEVVQAFIRVGQSEPLFRALTLLREGPGWATLDRVQQRVVEKRLLEARLTGIALTGEPRERFNALETELSDLTTRFSNQLLDANKAFSLDLATQDDVAGLPPSLLAQAAQAARAAGMEGASPQEGPWRITLDAPSYVPFMKHSRRRDLRERVYRAFTTRASAAPLDNTPVMLRILSLRAEKARLLGFRTYAELSLATKMAPSVEAAEALLEQLRAASHGAAVRDLEELRGLARGGLTPDGEVRHWDVEFLAERLREQRFAFTDEELRPYFPLPRVLDGLFRLAGRLLGVTIHAADGQAPVWHPDVRFFRVHDGDGRPVAGFYLDPYSRPQDKRGGAWMDECVSRRGERPGRAAREPVAYLVCNQTPPVGDRPSLMGFTEVETLFHEFGHGLQHMLTAVDQADVSGIRGVEWDAVELPSQFMENWCYHRETLRGMSRHVDTGQPLPDDTFRKILASRTFRAGSLMLRQVHFSRVDLELHHRFLANGAESMFDVDQRIARQTRVLPPLPEDRFLCSFAHIFGDGYAAGYYSYKWAEVLSADAFAAFEEAGLEDEAAVASTGKRFRDTVLSLGGSVHPVEVFTAFRGRGPTTVALLRHNGLLPGPGGS